ncbi:MAG TPA: hypothetical protein VL048_03655 [Xanthobacteraceae bacterium]|nr:hypothetical protein [Xanthobacteraceae bacterium]
MAYLLFMLIRAHHGERTARRVFAKWGEPPSPKRLRLIANMGLLDRLDTMKPRNVQRLARELAEENKKLPRAKQHGAGCTDPIELAQQIRRQVKLRDKAMAAGKWYGPIRIDD